MTSSSRPPARPGDMTAPGDDRIMVGVASRPLAGHDVSGDLHVVAPFDDGVLVSVIDGLGHGPEAAEASSATAIALRAEASHDPVDVVRRCHESIRGSRGVVMLVASLSYEAQRFCWCGVGNIEGWHCRWDGSGEVKRTPLLSSAGVVGYQLPTLRARCSDLAGRDQLLLATDGIRPEFISLATPDGDPAETAAAILGLHGRSTDDALVLVVRYAGVTR